MGKLVILRLLTSNQEGDIHAVLSIESTSDDSGSLRTEVSGTLPANPNLAHSLGQWQSHYLDLGKTRIQPQGIYVDRRQEAIDACQNLESEVRSQFNHWLLADSFRAIRDKWLAELMKEEVLILVRASEPGLLRLPWYLWDLVEQNPAAEVALNILETDSSAIRPIQSNHTSKKVKILAILGNREGIDLESDRQLLAHFSNAETTFLVEPERSALNDQLWEQHWDILFFAGHSRTEGDRGRIYINQKDSLTIAQLRHGLQRAVFNGLQLAIFNSCDGLGLALELQLLKLPHVIVMREPVTDRVAQAFLRYFLPAFASGQPLHLAVREARLRLQGLENELPGASGLPAIVQSAIAPPLTWQQLGHSHASTYLQKQWWQIPVALLCLLTGGMINWQFIAHFLAASPQPTSAKNISSADSGNFESLNPVKCEPTMQYKSRSSQVPALVRIVNRRKFPVKVYWIDYQGQRQHYFDLGAGKRRDQPTFISHPWLIAEARQGQLCLGIFRSSSKLGLIQVD